MNMKAELKQLEQQRQIEVRNLHVTYLRTKRDVRRAMSPDRLVRRHLGASLGIAALAGLLLAPRLGGHKKKGGGIGAKVGKWTRMALRKLFPKVTAFMPDVDATETKEREVEETESETETETDKKSSSRRSKGLLNQLLAEFAMVLLTRIDLPKLVMGFMDRFRGERGHEGNGHTPPRVTVADAGAVHEDPFSDLQ